MKQIFITGASTVYGVGGPNGGWADMIKREVSSLQYTNVDTYKEAYEVYNFARPGMTVEEAGKSLPTDVRHRMHDGSDIMIILSVGGNNVKCVGEPTNYVSTPEQFEEALNALFQTCHAITDNIVFVGNTPKDESKTTPKISPLNGQSSYFFNARVKLFGEIVKKVCNANNIAFISLFDEAEKLPWQKEYLAPDGLHMNDKGYHWAFEQIWPKVSKFID